MNNITDNDKHILPFAMKTGTEQYIYNLINDDVRGLGYDIVRIQLSGNKRNTLQIMIEPSDLRPLIMEDCSIVSRHISPILDIDDHIIDGKYDLEVSSPGVERPLTRICDFHRFVNHHINIRLQIAISGMKKLTAKLVGFDAESQELLCDYMDKKTKEILHIGIALHYIQSLFLIYQYQD